MKVGYALACEEHGPRELAHNARLAEEAGFDFLVISDHFHPWLDVQGHSPFVWTVIGAIAEKTERIPLGTGVTCPTVRIHPALVAQAAATAATMMPGRFFLGVGSGENLNEHIVGGRWPPPVERQRMLEEAVDIIRRLWEGGTKNYDGDFYKLQEARIYTLPDELPPIYLAASGPRAAHLAARLGDGLMTAGVNNGVAKAFRQAGGQDKPRYAQMQVCWAPDAADGRRTLKQRWPISAVGGQSLQELPHPRHFEEVTSVVTEEQVARSIPHGPNPQTHIEGLRKAAKAGFDHVWLHQVGPRQEEAIAFYAGEVLPALRAQP